MDTFKLGTVLSRLMLKREAKFRSAITTALNALPTSARRVIVLDPRMQKHAPHRSVRVRSWGSMDPKGKSTAQDRGAALQQAVLCLCDTPGLAFEREQFADALQHGKYNPHCHDVVRLMRDPKRSPVTPVPAPAPEPSGTPAPPMPEPEPEPEPVPSATDVTVEPEGQLKAVWNALGIADAIQSAVTGLIPSIVAQVKASVRVVRHEITEGAETRVIEGVTHKAFGECLNVLKRGRQTDTWLWLFGPSGTGKSHMAAQLAEALGTRVMTIGCAGGMSPAEFFGWLLPTGDDGRFEHNKALFFDFVKNGGLVLIDEIALCPSDVLSRLNGLLSNLETYVAIALDDPHLKVSPKFRLMCADNTDGTGSQDGYVRQFVDSSFRNRFNFRRIGYDKAMEEALYGGENLAVVERCWKLRDDAKVAGIANEVGSRFISRVIANMADGHSVDSAISLETEGWNDDDRATLGIAPFEYAA